MIRKNWLESCGRGALVVLFLFTLALVAIVAPRLSAQTALGTGIVLKPVSPPGFVVAPSVPLGYSPSSIASGALTSSGHTDVVTAVRAMKKATAINDTIETLVRCFLSAKMRSLTPIESKAKMAA